MRRGGKKEGREEGGGRREEDRRSHSSRWTRPRKPSKFGYPWQASKSRSSPLPYTHHYFLSSFRRSTDFLKGEER
jgi:hypothetical protein